MNSEQTGSLNATVLLLLLAAAAVAPYECGGILCSDRGQSCDAFQAILLEDISPRCNKSDIVYTPTRICKQEQRWSSG